MSNRLHRMTFTAVLVLAALAPAQTFTTLYNFTGGSDGGNPLAAVIQDRSGNLYGTTRYGGDLNCSAPYGCGVVFELNTEGTETVLHAFHGQPDGDTPYTPVIRDNAGNIYGTTVSGGTSSNCYPGCGTVFKIDAAGNEIVLYSFTGGLDGCEPYQGLVMDEARNLYGTSPYCGFSNEGTIFKVDSAGELTVLHGFAGGSSDGAYPLDGHLAMDKAGNIYGLTSGGGAHRFGVLYELSNKRKLTVLHSFGDGTSDGCDPLGSVVRDAAGNLYGTTTFDYECGSSCDGTIWKVSKKGEEIILRKFYRGSSACQPLGVSRDSEGHLYGSAGCGVNGYGVLYELSAKGKLTLLHSFDYSDGAYPNGEVLRTTKGTLFGTTLYGGTYGNGTVWSYVP